MVAATLVAQLMSGFWGTKDRFEEEIPMLLSETGSAAYKAALGLQNPFDPIKVGGHFIEAILWKCSKASRRNSNVFGL
jgi:hypothetical protein